MATTSSKWDPHVSKIYAPHTKDEIASADPDLRDAFIKGMPKIEENFYFIPNRQDPFFDMAMLYHSAHCYQEAMESYEKSIRYFGISFSTAYNIGLCYYLVDQFDKALAAFEKAVELDPNSEEAADWVKRIKEESTA